MTALAEDWSPGDPLPVGYPVDRWDEGGEAVDGAELIAAERRRHAEAEGWTPEHDSQHVYGELVQAALFYADPRTSALEWPWAELPRSRGDDRVRDLVKAGALIAAEIDRLKATSGG